MRSVPQANMHDFSRLRTCIRTSISMQFLPLLSFRSMHLCSFHQLCTCVPTTNYAPVFLPPIKHLCSHHQICACVPTTNYAPPPLACICTICKQGHDGEPLPPFPSLACICTLSSMHLKILETPGTSSIDASEKEASEVPHTCLP